MSWSTVLSWVPIEKRKEKKKILGEQKNAAFFFSGLQLYNSHFNQRWIRLRTAASTRRYDPRYFILKWEGEIFLSAVIIAHFYSFDSSVVGRDREWETVDTCATSEIYDSVAP